MESHCWKRTGTLITDVCCLCYTVRRREEVVEACLKPKSTVTAAAAAAIPSSSSSSSSSQGRGASRVVAAPAPATSAWTALPQSSSVTTETSLFEMAGVPIGAFYCDYCNVFCNSETQLDAHCASAKHKLSISSDREHQWNFRPPPLTVADGQYTLCLRSLLLLALYSICFYFVLTMCIFRK